MYVCFKYSGHAVKVEAPSNNQKPQGAKEENILAALDGLEAIRRLPRERVWGQDSYEAAKELAKFYGNITAEEIVDGWIRHYGPGWCQEKLRDLNDE